MENFNDYQVGDKVKRGPEKWIRTLGIDPDLIGPDACFENDIAIVKEPISVGGNIGLLYDSSNFCYWVDPQILLGHNFEWGEEIEVSDNGRYWSTVKFSGYGPGSIFLVKTFPEGSYRYARPIRESEILELTLDQIAEKFGVPVKRIKVKK